MTEKNEISSIIILEQKDGATLEVNVVELFAGVVGGEPQNTKTIVALLKEEAEARGSNWQPKTADALNILERAEYFYDIEWNRGGRPGYSFMRLFSGPPIIFERTFPSILTREFVDPQDAEQFQSLNPDWQKMES